MSPRIRLVIFALACLILLPAVAHVAWHMPPFGAHPLPYGDAINAAATAQRHVTNMVSAVNFDYRGFDTLGEEFMLLCAVTGVTVLLRGTRGEQTNAEPGRAAGCPIAPRSDAVVLISRMFGAVILLFGLYVALHAMTTPGGGFQGGVIAASGALLVFAGEGYGGWRRMVRSEAMDACEGLGATLYALCGLASMLLGLPFLHELPAARQRGQCVLGRPDAGGERRRRVGRGRRLCRAVHRVSGGDARRGLLTRSAGQSGTRLEHARRLDALGGGGLVGGDWPLCDRDQPQLRAPHRLHLGRAILDLRAAARGGLPVARWGADLLQPSARTAGGRPCPAGAGADRCGDRRYRHSPSPRPGAATP